MKKEGLLSRISLAIKLISSLTTSQHFFEEDELGGSVYGLKCSSQREAQADPQQQVKGGLTGFKM